ncbi:lysylphosphatidylglycerol synthase domain-containing protein [Ideonella sp. DXS29W]|uniref:Lysylphosphatidylglycerol synthase domain-containing protein n=1 Tax=Ideonella lacteola TaxID=2984193 RepID=A0ABU9BSL0_9BURK
MPSTSDAARRPWTRLLLASVLGLGLLVWLLRHLDLAPLTAAVAVTPVWLWALALAGLCTSYALRAERLRREWGSWFAADPARGTAPGFVACLALFLTHNAAIVVLPLRAGEAGYPWLMQRRFGVPLGDSLRSLLWLRLQDAAVLATLAALWLPPVSAGMRAGWAVLLGVAWGAALWFGGRLLAAASARVPAVGRFEAAWLTHRNDRIGWALCAANWLVKLAVFALVLQALAPLDALAAWRGALGGELASVLPLQGPAGLGTYEAGVWAAARLDGSAAGAAASAQVAAGALALHAFALAVALAAAAIIMPWAREPRATLLEN